MAAYLRRYVLNTRNPKDYHVAMYVRLSKKDEREDPSQSVTNQESLLREFVKQHRFSGFDICVDDGWSGTSLTDPAFSILDQAIFQGFALIAG